MPAASLMRGNRLGIPFVESSLGPGLDYYCHTAFEITSDQLEPGHRVAVVATTV